MKPKRIFLVRHGQSQGNADASLYVHTPDYQLRLTDLGINQAKEAGKKLITLTENGDIKFYVSPLWRTRQTFENLLEGMKSDDVFPKHNIHFKHTYQEDHVFVNKNGGILGKLKLLLR